MKLNTIHPGDCIEFMKAMPDKSVDLICTDPPYGLDYNNGDLASVAENVFYGRERVNPARPIANDGEDEAMALFEAMLEQAKRVLRPGGLCCCCCGGPKPLFARWTLLMDKYLNFKQAVVWDKGGLGMGMHYRRNYEFVLIASKGSPVTWNGGNNTPNVWRIGKIIPQKWEHPTAKPVELMAKIIDLHSDPGDVVFDPFVGGGATLVAAKLLGRNYIGCEIEPKFLEMANMNLSQEVMTYDGQ